MTIEWIFWILLVFYGLFEWNLWSYQKFVNKPLKSYPKVSILIPCRNEERRIEDNLSTLLQQNYPDFEVIVLDDNSEDKTWQILEKIGEKNQNLKLIKGKPLPSGWQGKNYACSQLAENANGEWLLFVDADTEHHPDMLKRALETAVHEKAGLLSTFPRQIFGSIGDALLVPLMFFVLLLYLPMFFVSKKTWKWAGNFSAACGQYALIKKEVYEEIGGHANIKARISEAPLLAKSTKDAGHKILLRDGSSWVSCRMYDGFKQAFEGFSRSLFASMGGSIGAMVFFLVFQTYVFIWPYIVLMMFFLGKVAFTWQLLFCLILPIWIRIRIHLRTGMMLKWTLLHVLSMIMYHWIMINSFIHYKIRKNTVWKNRAYAKPQI